MPPRARNPKSKDRSPQSPHNPFGAPAISKQTEAPYGHTAHLANSSYHKGSRAPTAAQRPKHLIVDGYNLIHSRPALKKLLQQFGTDIARDEFIKTISILHDYEGWRVTVVFDGQGGAMSIEYPLKSKLFGCVFSPGGVSADEVIQGLAENCVMRDDLLIVTSDSGIRVFIQTQGARCMDPEEFWRWVDEAGGLMRRSLGRQF